MRKAFIEALIEAAKLDERICLLTGDLGYGVLEPFRDAFPTRFFNCGVAEQNMVGIAAGLALSGKRVFTYSIVNFAVTRCLEQIRNDVCYHGLDVTVVAVGGGLAYGMHGYTHHGIEDIGFMRNLPNMTVIVPGDPREVTWATNWIAKSGGPAYIRLAKGGEKNVHEHALDGGGQAFVMRPPSLVTFICCGPVFSDVVAAADELSMKGLLCGVVSLPVIQPIDHQLVSSIASQSSLIVTVEEHSVIGGLGSSVCEVVSEIVGPRARVIRAGVGANKLTINGDQSFMRHLHGLDRDSLVAIVEAATLPEGKLS